MSVFIRFYLFLRWNLAMGTSSCTCMQYCYLFYGIGAIVTCYFNENIKSLHIYVWLFWNKAVYGIGVWSG